MKVTIIILIALAVAAMVGLVAGIIHLDDKEYQELNDYGKQKR